MTGIERGGAGFVVSAALPAEALKMTEEDVRLAMREGTITSRCEAGDGTDAGREGWDRAGRNHGSKTDAGRDHPWSPPSARSRARAGRSAQA